MTLPLACRLLIALLLAWAVAPLGAAVPVPVDVQIALFTNIWKLDRNFDASHGVVVAIVYQESYAESVAVKEDLMEAIDKQKLPITCVLINALTEQDIHDQLTMTNATVVYVAPLRAIGIGVIAEVTRRRGLRSITGVPEYVDAGVAVGIGVRKNRPLIVVNLGGARAEGSAFSSQLLELARIVGPPS